ncbi:MAG: peptidoglycan-binding protein [Myxococcales bacterium]|nr:peptidoglycan-binding protein [Myxococcales bacterium]
MSAPYVRRVLPKFAKRVREGLGEMAAAVKAGGALAPGAQGDAVVALQRRMRAVGLLSGPVDGTYGHALAEAVKEFQAAKKLPETGRVDADTLAAIRDNQLFVKDGFEGTPARLGQRGHDIRKVEQRLEGLGFKPGSVDGVFDRDTLAALERFRSADKEVPDRGSAITGKLASKLRERARRVEQDLKKLGLKPGKVDGNFGEQTEEAIRAFQRKNGLGRTGIADKKTRALLHEKAENAGSAVSDRVQKFIDVALAQRGDPYVFGAEGPNAFDCSGLIDYALKKAGVNIPRMSAAGYQRHFAGSKVSRENLKPGDLIFYWYPNTRGIPPGQASHVEIYLGNGKSMGTDNPSEGARVESVDWGAFIGGARVKQL